MGGWMVITWLEVLTCTCIKVNIRGKFRGIICRNKHHDFCLFGGGEGFPHPLVPPTYLTGSIQKKPKMDIILVFYLLICLGQKITMKSSIIHTFLSFSRFGGNVVNLYVVCMVPASTICVTFGVLVLAV